MQLRSIKLLVAICLCSLATPAIADISLPAIFSDHMVLQRNSDVQVWGTAEPGEELTVTFNDVVVKAKANPNGKWSTMIKTGEAGGPYTMEISAGKEDTKIVFSDVLIGEVWVCSGQSNMEWPINKALNPETEIEQAKNYPDIRLFTVERHASATQLTDFNKTVPWNCCSPETVKDFSAVAYFFGRELYKELKVPIGLVHSSWGGTRCEAWTQRIHLDEIDELKPLLEHWDASDDPTARHRPGNLFNGMIAPLSGFNFRGAIWYQGEANVGRGQQYGTLFPEMIKNWREYFGNDKMPFLFVQLAPFRYGNQSPEALPEVWDSQLKTLRTVENTGMAVTTDIGNVKDIHPKNKQEVGRRLALWALANQYQNELPDDKKEMVFSGPLYESISVLENKLRVTFDHVGGGLRAKDDQELTGFMICGEDEKFYPAKARVDGDTIELTAKEVSKPVAVRYGWDDSTETNLVNDAGLPASPFRSDDFKLLSEGTHIR